MDSYTSALLSALYANDQLVSSAPEILQFKENFMGGNTLVDGTGTVILETRPSAEGGETVEFSTGETAHLAENIHGSATLDFTGTTNDIVGTASIFGAESFSQGGSYIGTVAPDFTGNGLVFSNSSSETIASASPDFLGNTQIAFSSPLFETSTSTETLELQNSFAEIETLSSGVSAADLGSATDALDGMDFLGLF